MRKFADKEIKSWKSYLKKIDEINKKNRKKAKWVFRGQSRDWHLKTSLERAYKDYRLESKDIAKIEKTLIRDFRRRYHGEDRDIIMSDTLYCLSVMQHHGAPTRLLDFNYSPFIALFFSLEAGFKGKYVVWCINEKWCEDREKDEDIVRKKRIKMRQELKDDMTFKYLYLRNNVKFVFPENAFPLTRRLIIQQGVFLCPGNVSISFEKNLKAFDGWDKKENVIKLAIKFSKQEYKKALEKLHRMNINHESLFPGLDGFAKSLKSKLPIYEKTSDH